MLHDSTPCLCGCWSGILSLCKDGRPESWVGCDIPAGSRLGGVGLCFPAMETGVSVKKALGIGFGLALLSTGSWHAPALAASDDVSRPNILLMYLDDVSVNQRSLWCDAERTPRLARFCTEGVEFTNSIGSTPLCGPSRATLLTGRHGHNTGVTRNDNAIEDFDASVTLATELQDVGYHTLFAGKYVNGISTSKKKDVRDYAGGWDEFDVIWRRGGDRYKHFYDYRLWTPEGVSKQGTRPGDHSTKVTTERLAGHIRDAPEDQPILAVASLYSGHVPNIAMKRHVGSPKCADVRPWRGPSYNEADVSDKPAYVQDRPLLEKRGFDLRKRCEEMLSVDWAVGKLTDALRDAGRLDDTLIIFTSDNGFLLGDHRLPRGKYWPYAAPVPMQLLWPAVTGDERRVVTEPVSNVDIAPTLCEIAGCTMPETDGLSLLPLITGEADTLERPFVYTENLHPAGDMPPWYGIHTTGSYSDAAYWVYTELGTGERELYDITQDPYRLENLAGQESQAERVEELHELLHREMIEPEAVSFAAD